jgi:hypothetical protein
MVTKKRGYGREEKRSVWWGPTDDLTGGGGFDGNVQRSGSGWGRGKKGFEGPWIVQIVKHNLFGHCYQMSREAMEAKTTLLVSKPEP